MADPPLNSQDIERIKFLRASSQRLYVAAFHFEHNSVLYEGWAYPEIRVKSVNLPAHSPKPLKDTYIKELRQVYDSITPQHHLPAVLHQTRGDEQFDSADFDFADLLPMEAYTVPPQCFQLRQKILKLYPQHWRHKGN